MKISASIPMLLAAVLVVLKLLGKITLSWWMVFSPIWISFIAGILFLLGAFLVYLKVHK
jgi:hypothetical protein